MQDKSGLLFIIFLMAWLLIIAVLIGSGKVHLLNSKTGHLINNLALLNSFPHASFDPIDADYSHNRPAMRMLYATPLEISPSNRLQSSVLKSFSYDSKSQTISFELDPRARYSDGSAITLNDISTAILRLALNRPYFPVTRYISGLDTWIKSPEPLRSRPSGLTQDRNTLRIHLTKNLENALFRFTLEIFSIVPERCIDLETGKLSCEVPTPSGHFTIESKSPDAIVFLRRYPATAAGEKLPERLKISYLAAGRSDLAKEIDDATILVGWESSLSDPSQAALKKYSVRWLPRSWFTSVILNPNVPPFDDVNCRRLFAKAFRKKFHDLNDPANETEGSQFTSILPGYLPLKALENVAPIQNAETCREKLRSLSIRWAAVGGPVTPFRSALVETLKEFGQADTKPIIKAKYDEVVDSFLKNETSVIGYSSGFWAQDPVGDLQMYFTPTLHPVLNFVTSDPSLQKMLYDLDEVSDSSRSDAMAKINKHLFSDALSSVIANVRKFYIAKNSDIISEPAFALSSPAPWQIFRGEP